MGFVDSVVIMDIFNMGGAMHSSMGLNEPLVIIFFNI